MDPLPHMPLAELKGTGEPFGPGPVRVEQLRRLRPHGSAVATLAAGRLLPLQSPLPRLPRGTKGFLVSAGF